MGFEQRFVEAIAERSSSEGGAAAGGVSIGPNDEGLLVRAAVYGRVFGRWGFEVGV